MMKGVGDRGTVRGRGEFAAGAKIAGKTGYDNDARKTSGSSGSPATSLAGC